MRQFSFEIKKVFIQSALLAGFILINACTFSPTNSSTNSPTSSATSQPVDPLKNTKHLVTQGHKSLYENGAFHVPNTSIRLIPPGPSAMEFAGELLGISARQSLTTSLKNAADSFSVVSVGTKNTFKVSQAMYKGGEDFSAWVTQNSRPGSVLLLSLIHI